MLRSKICRHCQRYRINRPRGLCWLCYYDLTIRALYPGSSCKYAARGIKDRYGKIAPPPVPTRAIAGSSHKVKVMAQRAAAGFGLWHPDDNREIAERLKCERGRHKTKGGSW